VRVIAEALCSKQEAAQAGHKQEGTLDPRSIDTSTLPLLRAGTSGGVCIGVGDKKHRYRSSC